jgi:two-component system, cell cycle sensor histidine kinase and response regulator CckA
MLKRRTILLVEDNVVVRFSETQMLIKAGYDVVSAPSGEVAIEILKGSAEIDLILMDINLEGGIDGTEAAQMILKDHDIPIVFLSGHTEKEIVEKTGALASYGYVVKNSGITVLDASIKMAFRLHDAHQEVKRAAELFQVISDTSIDGFCLVGSDGRILDVNNAYCEMTGYSRNELLSRYMFDQNFEEHAEIFREYSRCLAVKSYDRLESQYRRKDGRIIDVEVNATYQKEHGQYLAFVRDITGRKRAEKELNFRHSLMSYIIKHDQSGIAVHDRNLNYLFVSDQYLSQYHIENMNVIGRHHYEVFPDLPQKWRDVHQRVLAGAIESSDEDVFYREDGSFQYTRWVCRPWYEDVNSIGGLIVYTEVIDKWKELEDKLRRSEERLQLALSSADMGIFDLDIQNGTVFLDSNSCRILGVDSSISNGKLEDFILRIFPDDQPIVKAAFTRAYRVGTFKIEFRTLWPNKDVHHIAARGRVQFDSEKRPIRMTGLFWDVTDRKNAEKALQESEERFQKAFNANPAALTIARASDGKYVDTNSTFLRMVEYDLDEVIGHTAKELSIYVDYSEREKDIDVVKRQGFVLNQEIDIRTKYGKIRRVLLSLETVSIGQERHILSTFIDISERKNLEAQLLQAQKMEAIGALAGGVAHDFNNILTAISGFGYLLGESMSEDDPKKSYLDEILASADKAANLTSSLLAFSRKQPIDFRPLDINEAIRNTTKLLRRLLTEDIELTTELTDGPLVIMSDSTPMNQILINLATNARDAMPTGGSLLIETRRVTVDEEFAKIHGFTEQGVYALISFTDNGAGMDEATKAHIFEPFFTTKIVSKGTGLGLSVVYGVIAQHKGYIEVESTPGEGTTFLLYFQVADVQDVHEYTLVPEEILEGAGTILVAEDDHRVRELVVRILERYGYTTLQAKDGEDAIIVYQSHKDDIDLVLLDVVMPRKNGREALDEIISINPLVKAVFLSGYTGDVVMDKGVQKENVNFLQKPVSVTKLLSKVKEVLNS